MTNTEEEHSSHLAIAGSVIRDAMNTLGQSGVYGSLIEILKTMQYWPSWVDKSDPDAPCPAFGATEIRVNEETEDNDIVRSVSFSYLDEAYDFVSRIERVSSADSISGVITLHENGEQVIGMEIEQVGNDHHCLDHFNFRELNLLKFSTWIEKIVALEKEIELHLGRM